MESRARRSLADLYESARSDDWSQRAEAGRELAQCDLADVELAVRRLLDDADIGVIGATADRLMRRGDAPGVGLILARLAGDSDEQVGQTLLRTLWEAEESYGLPVADLIRSAMNTGGKAVRDGGQEALDWHVPPR